MWFWFLQARTLNWLAGPFLVKDDHLHNDFLAILPTQAIAL